MKITQVLVTVTLVTEDGHAFDRSAKREPVYLEQADTMAPFRAAKQAAVEAADSALAFIESGDSRRKP